MRMRWKLTSAAAALAAVSAAAYGELVLDIRVPRSSLAEIHGPIKCNKIHLNWMRIISGTGASIRQDQTGTRTVARSPPSGLSESMMSPP